MTGFLPKLAMTRTEIANWFRSHGGSVANIQPQHREELAAMLESDHLTPESLRIIVNAQACLSGARIPSPILDQLIASLSPPPVVKWVDVGCVSVAESGDKSLLVEHYGGDWLAWSVRSTWDGSSICTGRNKTRAEAKAAAESKLAELMRGA